MVLVLKAVDQGQELRVFSCNPGSIQAAFQVLSDLVASGNTLAEAYVLESNSRTELPIAAFDGQTPFVKELNALQRDWEAILAQPARPAEVDRAESIAILTRRSQLCHDQIVIQQEMIDRLGDLLDQTYVYFTEEPRRSRLINHYQTSIENRQVQLAATLHRHSAILAKLLRLTA